MKNILKRTLNDSAVRRNAFLTLALILASFLCPIAVTYGKQFEVKLISLSSPVSPGNPASMTIKTVPSAKCQITVQYLSGPSKAKGLIPQTADSEGQVTWTWLVGSRTTPGTWPIIVTCLSGKSQGRLQTSFIVK
jgi:hypothetical protein